jgi:hypothetical protein
MFFEELIQGISVASANLAEQLLRVARFWTFPAQKVSPSFRHTCTCGGAATLTGNQVEFRKKMEIVLTALGGIWQVRHFSRTAHLGRRLGLFQRKRRLHAAFSSVYL